MFIYIFKSKRLAIKLIIINNNTVLTVTNNIEEIMTKI